MLRTCKQEIQGFLSVASTHKGATWHARCQLVREWYMTSQRQMEPAAYTKWARNRKVDFWRRFDAQETDVFLAQHRIKVDEELMRFEETSDDLAWMHEN